MTGTYALVTGLLPAGEQEITEILSVVVATPMERR